MSIRKHDPTRAASLFYESENVLSARHVHDLCALAEKVDVGRVGGQARSGRRSTPAGRSHSGSRLRQRGPRTAVPGTARGKSRVPCGAAALGIRTWKENKRRRTRHSVAPGGGASSRAGCGSAAGGEGVRGVQAGFGAAKSQIDYQPGSGGRGSQARHWHKYIRAHPWGRSRRESNRKVRSGGPVVLAPSSDATKSRLPACPRLGVRLPVGGKPREALESGSRGCSYHPGFVDLDVFPRTATHEQRATWGCSVATYRSCASVATAPKRCSTRMPELTRPKMVCLLSR